MVFGGVRRKAAYSLTITILLTGILASIVNIQPVKANGTIYIRADGSIDPPTAPIKRNGNTYTFTNNIYDSIVVERSNVIIDGAGYILQGTRSYEIMLMNFNFGISVDYTTKNVTIKRMVIQGFDVGIYGKYIQ